MSSIKPKVDAYAVETISKLEKPGCLLVGAKHDGECNVMTIGWGLVGIFWRMPVFLVAVRHSRFTHAFIEDTDEFTINVPKRGMNKIVSYCGEVSGRDHDKFKECRLDMIKGKEVDVPVIKQCGIHYECKVVHKLEVKPKGIPADVKKLLYKKGNYHTLYLGKIVAVY